MEFSDFCDVLFLDDLEVSDVDLMHKTTRSGCLLVASCTHSHIFRIVTDWLSTVLMLFF